MKFTIIYDNTADQEGLKPDWGFACLVEAYGIKILFDTGACGGILLHNMRKLDIEPTGIEGVFISHDHWDHIDGLDDFLALNPVRVYLPGTCKKPLINQKVVRIKGLQEIYKDIYSSGEIGNIEQSLFIKKGGEVTVLVGCSHPGVGTILKTAAKLGNPTALIGGLHGFDDFKLLRDLKVICPTHCTNHIKKIKDLYSDKYVEGGVGKVIEI